MKFQVVTLAMAASLFAFGGLALAQTPSPTPKPTTTPKATTTPKPAVTPKPASTPKPAATPAPAAVLDLDGVMKLVQGLGYEAKLLEGTTTKFGITITTGSFNVPLGFEISPSKRYIWITANLGESKLTGDLALALLKRGSEVQPTQFWITSRNLLQVGQAMENHDVTPANTKLIIDKIASDIGKTSDIWQDLSPRPAATTTP